VDVTGSVTKKRIIMFNEKYKMQIQQLKNETNTLYQINQELEDKVWELKQQMLTLEKKNNDYTVQIFNALLPIHSSTDKQAIVNLAIEYANLLQTTLENK
jgi:protein subunit release factor A